MIRRALAVLFLVAAPLVAQDPPKKIKPQRPHRTGLWAELAAGGGRLSMGCTECANPIRAPGSAGFIRLGGTLNDRVMLAWESAGFVDETFGFADNDTTDVAEMETVSIVVLWFPWRHGFFMKGGVGVAQGRFTLANGAAAPDSTEGTGIGMTLGVGWDFPISRKFAISVNAASFITAIGDITLPTRRVDDVIGSTYQMSVGLTFR